MLKQQAKQKLQYKFRYNINRTPAHSAWKHQTHEQSVSLLAGLTQYAKQKLQYQFRKKIHKMELVYTRPEKLELTRESMSCAVKRSAYENTGSASIKLSCRIVTHVPQRHQSKMIRRRSGYCLNWVPLTPICVFRK